MDTQHVIVDGLDIRYHTTGSGPVAFFLHGWGSQMESFSELMRTDSWKTHRVIALDLPGFGGSQAPREDWDVERYAKFVAAFLQKISIDSVDVIVGHSFGGRIALKAVSQHLIVPSKMVLIASAGAAVRHTVRTALYYLVAKVGKIVTLIPPFVFFRKQFRTFLYRSAGSGDYQTAGVLTGTFKKVIAEDLLPDARLIVVPTLLIWGERDDQTPLSEGRSLSKALQQSQLIIVSGAGHFVHEQCAVEVGQHIHKFLSA